MNDYIVVKLKKYLLFMSVFLFFALGGHLLYLYTYEGAQSEPEQGGTVSEAIIGSFPHLNPLVPSNDHNAYINGLLYRSLLRYSSASGSLEPDLASCNIENLLYIECTLEANLLWSDNSPITVQDIAATLNLIRETKVNPILASLLENTEIVTSETSIIFKNTNKDVNFVGVLLQPIIPQKITETLNSESVEGKFSENNGIYSGYYVLSSVNQDDTVGITKLTLAKNKSYFGNPLYIDFLILSLFKNEEHFLKNKNSFNIFNDKDALIAGSVPRLQTFDYYISQFVGSFLNTETLSLDVRKYIINSISPEAVIDSVGEKTVFPVKNPFLTEQEIEVSQKDFDIATYLEKKGYYSKKDFLKNLLDQEEKKTSETPLMSQEAKIETPSVEKKTQSSLKYVVSPSTQKYNFVSEDNILIEGKVDTGTEAVYINDYKLNGFSAGDDVFYYRLLESYDSITSGENTYTIYFEKNGKKEKKEEFVYFYETDVEKLEKIESSFFTPIVQTGSTIEKIETPEKTQALAPKINTSLTQEQIQAFDDTLYYNAKGEVFEIEMVYTLADTRLEQAAASIKKQLQEAGISVKLSGATLADMSVGVRNESLSYDMLLLGINLGYFGSNIFPYFHSSQVKNGYNFANFKKLSLDILLEELTSNTLETSKKQELQSKMIDILSEESILQVYYTPKIELLIDKNIKNINFPSYLPDSRLRYIPLLSAYLSEKRTINTEEKGFFGFFGYLLRILLS